MRDNDPGTRLDRLRLFLIAKLLSEEDQAAFVESHADHVAAIPEAGPCLKFVKNLQAWSVPGASPTGGEASGWRIAQSLSKNLARVFSAADAPTQLPVTRLVDMLLTHQRPGSSAAKDRAKALEIVSAADPRAPGALVDMNTAQFSNVVVFMLGGGSMTEYDNLKQTAKTAKV